MGIPASPAGKTGGKDSFSMEYTVGRGVSCCIEILFQKLRPQKTRSFGPGLI
jgi:hypothetical protein